MSEKRDKPPRVRKPVDEVPVLSVVVDAAAAEGGRTARADALVAQIERAVLEELTPRLEDAVHQAVRAAVDRALAEQEPGDPEL